MQLIRQKVDSGTQSQKLISSSKKLILLASLSLALSANYAFAKNTANTIKDEDEFAGTTVKEYDKNLKTKLQVNHVDAQKGLTGITDNKNLRDFNAPDTSNSEVTSHHKLSKKTSKAVRSRLASNDKSNGSSDSNYYNLNNISTTEYGLNTWLTFGIAMGKDGKNANVNDHSSGMHMLFAAGADMMPNDKITVGLILGYGRSSVDITGALSEKKKAENSLNAFLGAVYAGFDIDSINMDVLAHFAFGSHNSKELKADLGNYSAMSFGLTAAIEYALPIEQVNLDIGGELGFDMISIGAHNNKFGAKQDKTRETEAKIADGLTPKNTNNIFSIHPYITIKDIISLDGDMKFDYKASVGYKFVATLGDLQWSLDDIIPGTTNDDFKLKYREMDAHSAAINLGAGIEMQKNIKLAVDVELEIGKSFFYGAVISAAYKF